MTYLSPEYKAYIASPEWQAMRQRKFRQVGKRCQDCGLEPGTGVWMHVHHLTYVRLGHELLRDLRVLCDGPMSRNCHDRAHEAKRRGQQYVPQKSWWRHLLGA